MKIQIKVMVFKISGKYYTDDYAVVDAIFMDNTIQGKTPIFLDHYELNNSIRKYFDDRNQYKEMILLTQNELLVPALLMPNRK